ncbi:MAG: methylcobamide--CoM methyltransferase [Clostridiales bacterium]|nr:methylcobamide--CoM methyltransferase [Clostridiales bacterium]
MVKPLTREQVIACVERRDNRVIPAVMCRWWGEGLYERHGARLDALAAQYPDDVHQAWFVSPGGDTSPIANPSYRWGFQDDYSSYQRHSIGGSIELLRDWDELDLFLADFPSPDEPGIMDGVVESLKQAGGKYRLGCFWRLFHEKLWEIRGMEHLMLDYYDNIDGLRTIGERLLAFHNRIVDRYAELGFDGIFTSDDLGHQGGPMMSPAVFRELYLPLYKAFIGHAHEKGLHVWLHSCGDNTVLMDMLIEAGLDVFHPVQKHCMDEEATARQYGGQIAFLYGIDVQNLLPNGTPDEIEREIAQMARIFRLRGGSVLFAAGNGIMGDTPIENIEAMLRAAYAYR